MKDIFGKSFVTDATRLSTNAERGAANQPLSEAEFAQLQTQYAALNPLAKYAAFSALCGIEPGLTAAMQNKWTYAEYSAHLSTD